MDVLIALNFNANSIDGAERGNHEMADLIVEWVSQQMGYLKFKKRPEKMVQLKIPFSFIIYYRRKKIVVSIILVVEYTEKIEAKWNYLNGLIIK